jgi:hypothetical protein
MRAREIQEATTQFPIIAQTANCTWYETDAGKIKNWYKQMYGRSPRLHDAPDTRYFVMAPTGQAPLGFISSAVMQQGSDLSSVETTGTFVTKNDGVALQALADATQVKNGEHIWGDFVLYDGKVYLKDGFLSAMPQVAEISTGPVYEIPPDALWTLGKIYLKYKVSAQKVVVFRNTTADVSSPWSSASIRAGVVSDIQSQRKLDKVTEVKLGKEVSQALGLTQKVTVNTHIIPESKLHNTLRAIHDNPGVTRWDLYWRVLNLKKLPTYQSAEDSASELVKLGLATLTQSATPFYTQDSDKHYTITTIGKLVLARVNAGKPVAKTSLIKQ